MKPILALAAFALLLTAIPDADARRGEAYVAQVSAARDGAYVRQLGGPSIRVSVVFRPQYPSLRLRPYHHAFPIPPEAAPGLSGDTALGFFLNNNRGKLFEEHERIFRDFLR